MLMENLPTTKMISIEDFGISVDAKEAVSFAILAWSVIKNLPNNVPAATGAEKPVILGKIVPAL
jgi:anhydro-N-acetylmuramic acid kinase